MTYIRIRYRKQGGNYHCRVFTSPIQNGTYANCGELCFDEREWPDIRDKFSRAEFIDEVPSAFNATYDENARRRGQYEERDDEHRS